MDESLACELQKYDRAAYDSVQGTSLLVLDCCSDDHWPDTAIRWHRRGRPLICIFPEGPMRYAEQLRAIYLGASAIVCVSPELGKELRSAVHAVLEGKVWYPADVLARYVKQRPSSTGISETMHPLLTVREEQVVSFVVKKFRNKEIADALDISERTVKYHISHILEKLNIGSRSELTSKVTVQSDGYALRKCG